MDRRDFLKFGSAAVVAAGLGEGFASALRPSWHYDREPSAYPKVDVTCENASARPQDLSFRFLGTGAAGWFKDHSRRRHTSALVDGRILIDFTESAAEMLPESCRPDVLFVTHSHSDHFQPEAIVPLGLTTVYVGATWAGRARSELKKAAKAAGVRAPKVVPLAIGQRVKLGDLVFTALPANHAIGDKFIDEQALIYLIEKGTTAERLGVRLLYATDTGGIMGVAGRISGVDPHVKNGRPITAFVMEGTIGLDMDEDWRIMNHSSVALVARTVHMMIDNGRYLPPPGQPAYITHMSMAEWPSHEELQSRLPGPLRASCDGLDVVFRAVD